MNHSKCNSLKIGIRFLLVLIASAALISTTSAAVGNSSMGDLVWEDLNVNGIQDPGEPGIAGVTVNIYSCDGNLVDTTVTDAVGNYNFIAEEGDYFVEFEAPVGYVFTPQDQGADDAMDSDADATTGQTVCTILNPEEIDYTWDAGMYQPASIGDFVWEDLNANGIQDAGEQGFSGATVQFYDCSGNLLAMTITDGTGFYQFSGIIPGEYYIEFALPAGYFFSPQDQGTFDTIDSDVDITSGLTTCIFLGSGTDYQNRDAGVTSIQWGGIGNLAWNDLNNDGIQDKNESGIPNVTVELFDCESNHLATTITNSNGTYQFIGLESGNYSVGFVLPAGYIFSPQNQGADDTADSDANPATGLTTCIALDPGEIDMTLDAGFLEVIPGVDVEKYTNGLDKDTDGLTGIVIGDTITWKYIITNTGNVPLGNIVLTDDKQGIIPCPKNTLSPGESMECEMDDVAKYGHYVNTANVTAQFDGFIVSDEDVGEYYGYEPDDNGWEPNAVPTARPVITALLLGVFMVLLLKRDKQQ